MKKILGLVFCLLGIFSSQAFSDDIRLGTPQYGGTGCPANTASVTLSPDNKVLTILFDEYIVEAGGSTRKKFARKSCNIAIPIHIPQGISVSLFKIDYRGYVMAPRGGEARFSVEYFFAGQRGPLYTKIFEGPYKSDYLLTNTIPVGSIVWSECGASINARVNSSMQATSNASMAEVLATVDSVDVKSGIIYHLQWKQCN